MLTLLSRGVYYSKLVDDYQELREFDAATQTVLDLNDALRGRKQKKP